ncbi:MAG: SGNH/GDSL hydrolase family protein [Gemmatimonadales bacterium]|nr:SGNH/GDSL hydrolase family protein [Gemmatimonadales bacterium]
MRMLLAVTTMLMAGAGPTSAQDGAPPARILSLGDSYTIGEAVPEAERWPNQLARLLGAEGIAVEPPRIIAKTGWTTDELDLGINRENPTGRFALVTLLIGVNNQYRGRELTEYRLQFRELLLRAVTFAGGTGARVLVLSIPDWGVTPFGQRHATPPVATAAAIDRFNWAAKDEVLKAGAEWVDVTAISRTGRDEPAMTASDGLHPSGAQYARWAEAALPAARRILRERQ